MNSLGPSFTTEVMPTPVPEPSWVAQNFKLGQDLGLPDEWLNGDEGLAVFSAMVYGRVCKPEPVSTVATNLDNGQVNWAMAAH